MKCPQCNHAELIVDSELEHGACWQCHHAMMQESKLYRLAHDLASCTKEELEFVLGEAERIGRRNAA